MYTIVLHVLYMCTRLYSLIPGSPLSHSIYLHHRNIGITCNVHAIQCYYSIRDTLTEWSRVGGVEYRYMYSTCNSVVNILCTATP